MYSQPASMISAGIQCVARQRQCQIKFDDTIRKQKIWLSYSESNFLHKLTEASLTAHLLTYFETLSGSAADRLSPHRTTLGDTIVNESS